MQSLNRGIRTYALRTMRMSEFQKRSLAELSDRYCVAYRPGPYHPADAFTDDRPGHAAESARYVLEIGFGMGESFVALAEADPTTCYIGIEVHKPGVGRVLGELEKREVKNVRIVWHDAIETIGTMFAPHVFSGVHIFFPDPWPKKRHHKRRMVQGGFPEFLAPIVKPNGYAYVVTDWAEYAEQILTVFSRSEVFANKHAGFAPAQPWRPETAFERKARSAGRSVYEVLFERV